MSRQLARLAKEAKKSRQADARRRATHPGNPDVLVCRTFTGAKLVRTSHADGTTSMDFVHGQRRTYIERRSDLENPGGRPTGAMPSAIRGTHLQPVPNVKPQVTERKSVSWKPWDGIAGTEPSGRNDLRSSEIHPPVIRSFTGKSNGGKQNRVGQRMNDRITKQNTLLHHK